MCVPLAFSRSCLINGEVRRDGSRGGDDHPNHPPQGIGEAEEVRKCRLRSTGADGGNCWPSIPSPGFFSALHDSIPLNSLSAASGRPVLAVRIEVTDKLRQRSRSDHSRSPSAPAPELILENSCLSGPARTIKRLTIRDFMVVLALYVGTGDPQRIRWQATNNGYGKIYKLTDGLGSEIDKDRPDYTAAASPANGRLARLPNTVAVPIICAGSSG